MHRYLVLLYYYTLAVTIGLFVWAIGFAARPTGLLAVLLAIPVCIYFLLAITRKKAVAAEAAVSTGSSIRVVVPLVVLATLFVSAFSIYLYTFVNPQAPTDNAELAKVIQDLQHALSQTDSGDNTEALAKEVREMKARLDKSSALGISTASGATPTPSVPTEAIGFVTIADKNRPTVTAYKEKTLTSAVVGRVEQGKTYFFLKKEPGWYYIGLTSELEGWVSSQYMKETTTVNP